jgi:hypothetical protein
MSFRDTRPTEPPGYDDEIPECCDTEMKVDDAGNCTCLACGNIIYSKAEHEAARADYLYELHRDNELIRELEDRDKSL